MESKWCLLAGIVFLGVIVVTDGSKSEKKNAHKKKQETKGPTKNGMREKMAIAGIYRGLEYESLRLDEGPFVVAKTYYTTTKHGSLQ